VGQADYSDEAVESLIALARLDPRLSRRIREAVRELARSGRGDRKKLKGRDVWRLRVGNYRVLYTPMRDGAVRALEIDDRKDVDY
jgi:mRNA-degrading endonuclease RelE of RelBE toxin-antitoxin system